MKKLVCILLAVGVLFSLAACSGEEKTENSALSTLTLTNEDQSANVSLKYTDELSPSKDYGDNVLTTQDKTLIMSTLYTDEYYDEASGGGEKITFCGYDGHMLSIDGSAFIYLMLEEKEETAAYLKFSVTPSDKNVAEKLAEENNVETYLKGIQEIQYQEN